jgi:hypothetical protein
VIGAAPQRPRAPRGRAVARKYMIPSATRGTTCPTAGRPVYSGPGRQAEQRRSVVTDRRDEERDRSERKDAERRREEDQRRSDELREAWRRNHPSRPEEDDERRPGRGRT